MRVEEETKGTDEGKVIGGLGGNKQVRWKDEGGRWKKEDGMEVDGVSDEVVFRRRLI